MNIGRKYRVDPSHVWDVFIWAHNDSFWSANIRSPAKLHKQFEELSAKMEAIPKVNLWDLSDSALVKMADDKGIKTSGKTKKELIEKLS